MNAAEHKAKAEELLADLDEAAEEMSDLMPPAQAEAWNAIYNAQLARAQVHATLATIPEREEA